MTASISGTALHYRMQQRLTEWLYVREKDVYQTLSSALAKRSAHDSAALEARQNLFLFQQLASNTRLMSSLRSGFQNLLDAFCHPQQQQEQPFTQTAYSSVSSPLSSPSIASTSSSSTTTSSHFFLPVNSANVPQIEHSDQFQDAVLYCIRHQVNLSAFFDSNQHHLLCLRILCDEIFIHLSTMKALLSALTAAATLTKIVADISRQLIDVIAHIDADLFSLAMCARDLRHKTTAATTRGSINTNRELAEFVQVRHQKFSTYFRQLLRATVMAYRLARDKPLHRADVLRLLCVAFAHQYLYSVGYQVGQAEANEMESKNDDAGENDGAEENGDKNEMKDVKENDETQSTNIINILDVNIRPAMTEWVNSAKDSLRADYGLEWCMTCFAWDTRKDNDTGNDNGHDNGNDDNSIDVDVDISRLAMHFLRKPIASNLSGIHTAVVLAFCLILVQAKLVNSKQIKQDDMNDHTEINEMNETKEIDEASEIFSAMSQSNNGDNMQLETTASSPPSSTSFSTSLSLSHISHLSPILSSSPLSTSSSSLSLLSSGASLKYTVHSFDGSSVPWTARVAIEKLCSEAYPMCESPEFQSGYRYWVATTMTATNESSIPQNIVSCMRTHAQSKKSEKWWTLMYVCFQERHKSAIKAIARAVQEGARVQKIDLFVLVNVGDIDGIMLYSDCGFTIEDDQGDQWLQMRWSHRAITSDE